MILTPAQAERIEDQIDARVIPSAHPTAAQLETIFGGHTFFVGPRGLHVVEPAAANDTEHSATLIKLANWEDREKTKLLPQGPEIVGNVDLDTDD